jgi:hypothetical protein
LQQLPLELPELLLLLALSVPLLSRPMNLTRNRLAALPRKSLVRGCLATLLPTVLVLMASLFHPRYWPPLVEPQSALLLVVLLPPVLLQRTTFTVCKWTSIPRQRMNWSSALELWFGCFTSMMMDG